RPCRRRGAGHLADLPQRLEPDVEHRTLPQAALRTSRDQGAEGQLHGPEEPQGVGKGRRYQEEKGRQEEDRGQESQIVQADRQTAEKCQARSAGFAGSQQRRHGAVEAQEARRSITGRCSAAALASAFRGAKALPAADASPRGAKGLALSKDKP